MTPADTPLARQDDSESSQDDGQWQRLRSLLLGTEQASLRALAGKVGDRDKLTRSVASVLAEAIALRAEQNDRLTRALTPLINDGLQRSVRKDPQPLVDALYPIIGRVIRRSVTEILADMMQSFNRAVEQSFSPRALKWRFDAWRTGQSYASIVLMNTLVYRVEQVFLIHRETGLLLGHVYSEQSVVQDPDMVSGMLTAIRDFVGDSFSVSREDSVDSIRLGDLSVQVRVGPKAVLAAVVRGNPPESIRQRLSEALESVHRGYAGPLAAFDGNTRPFVHIARELEPCLTAQACNRAGVPWRAYALLILIASMIVWWRVSAHQSTAAWNDILQKLSREPGLVVIEADRGGGAVIHGLRDPLARDPVEVIGAARERRFAINWDWKPYMSMEPRIIAVRAGLLLQPPRTVVFTLQGGTLHVSGVASESWLRGARTRALLIPGITAFDDAAVSDNDRAAIDRARAALAAATLYFEAASDVISAKEQEKLDALLPTLASIREEIGALPKRYLVEITGRADAPGTVEFNLRLSQDRAEAVRQYLIARGVPTALLVARGIGVGDSPSNSMGHNVLSRHTEADESERRVNFALVPDDAATAP